MVNLFHGNCLDILKTLPENSLDSCVTDPPYGLSFMGKSWDYDVPNADIWTEVYRVLKPGAHLLAFFGSRTYHRGVVQIEDAGFEIRDQIMWVYGSGFPKSHNVSKSIDRMAGAEREVVGTTIGKGGENLNIKSRVGKGDDPSAKSVGAYGVGAKQINVEIPITAPSTEEAKQWEGWGTALKPSHESIVLARKPINQSVAANVLEYGTGALNIDGCRVDLDGDTKQASAGRWPANFIHDGSDEVLEHFPNKNYGNGFPYNYAGKEYNNKETSMFNGDKPQAPSNYNDSGSAARFFYCPKANKKDRDEGLTTEEIPVVTFQTENGTSGKASSISADRNTSYKNNHPTVKPTELMRYLCRLITPPNGVILDPFMGSGSTGKAAKLEGFEFVGIELEENYFKIAEQRINNVHVKKTLDKFMD